MKKVIVDIKVKELLNTKFRSDKKEIISYFRKLEQNPNLGDFVFGISNVDAREIKIKGIRVFTIQYRNELYVTVDDTFFNTLKIVDIVKKNKSKEQQKIIDDIKHRVKKFGMDI